MTRTYYKCFYGDIKVVEAAVRKFDQIFRRMYNVYGGKRLYSRKDADGNYEVAMSYAANWVESSFLPEFSIQAIERRFWSEAERLENTEEFWCSKTVEG